MKRMLKFFSYFMLNKFLDSKVGEVMKKNMLYIMICVFVLVIFSFSALTFARYAHKTYGTSNLQTASMVIDANIGSGLSVVLNEMIPGSVEDYNFSVSNFKSDRISEVSSSYRIKITKTNNLPVSFSLYKDGVLTNVLDTNLETPSYIFNGDEEQTHNYQLRIEWDGSINDYKYANLEDTINISVDAMQYLGD